MNQIDKVYAWKNRNDLKQREFKILLETWRRVQLLKDGNCNRQQVLLCYPYQAKSAKERGYIVPYGKETPRVLNWYNLTQTGALIVRDLDIDFNNELNTWIYEL